MAKTLDTCATNNTADIAPKVDLRRKVRALYSLLGNIYGQDKLILKASKLDALQLVKAKKLEKRVLGLKKIVFDDPTVEQMPSLEEIPEMLAEIEDRLADTLARKAVEDDLEQKIAVRMQEKHEDYLKDVKKQVLKDESGPENPRTLKKYAEIEKLNAKKLSSSAMEFLRPQKLAEIVGQKNAIKALMSKLASPYPQHILLYGPPGVGKTTAARLALEAARELAGTSFTEDSTFVEIDGATLRWDPRETTNPLLGSVHDPIYQGARRDMVDGGVPEPKQGLVTDAHGGILFIDEIGEMDLHLQSKLLKVLEDKYVSFDSSYYDPSDPAVPQYIKRIFEEGLPADFVLIGATTHSPAELNAALRSRCAAVYFEPLNSTDIEKIVKNAAKKLGVRLHKDVAKIIGEYTIEGRQAVNMLADAYGLAIYISQAKNLKDIIIMPENINEVIQAGRMTPSGIKKASVKTEVGKVFALGVRGYLGSILEIEAVSFPAKERGKGQLRFNETAGSMTKDSIFNASSLIRKLTGEDMRDYDFHINIVGGANIDGPSAGVAMLIALLSTIKDIPVRQDVALTGEVSIQGKVKPVGGLVEKIYGAKMSGMKKIIVPAENFSEIPANEEDIEIVSVNTVEEAIEHLFDKKDLSLLGIETKK